MKSKNSVHEFTLDGVVYSLPVEEGKQIPDSFLLPDGSHYVVNWEATPRVFEYWGLYSPEERKNSQLVQATEVRVEASAFIVVPLRNSFYQVPPEEDGFPFHILLPTGEFLSRALEDVNAVPTYTCTGKGYEATVEVAHKLGAVLAKEININLDL